MSLQFKSRSKCRKHPHATEADARHEAIRIKIKWRLKQFPSTYYCDVHRAYHVKGPSVVSRKNQFHSDRSWEMLLSNPDLLTDQVRRSVGANLSTPSTHKEVGRLMLNRKAGRSRRAGKKKSMRDATSGSLRRS